MSTIRIGIQIHPQHTTYASIAEAIQKIDGMGVDTMWTWDHFFPLYGEKDGNHFEGWTLLTAMGMLTQNVEFGCMVLCNSYRNPAHLSQMAKTLDHISDGRLILGLGAGWFERDYDEYGYEFGTAGDRLRALRKSLPIIKERWEIDPPKPTREIPICIGGGGEKVTLKITAEHAHIWNGFGPPETYKHKSGVLDKWCNEIGRDPAEIERSVLFGIDAFDTVDDLVDAGATHLIMAVGDPWDYDAVQKLIEWRDSRR